MKSVFLALLLAGAVLAQSKFTNPGFEQGPVGAIPTGWMMPQMLADAGFSAKTVEDNCRTGARCAMLTGVANPPQNMFGNLIQTRFIDIAQDQFGAARSKRFRAAQADAATCPGNEDKRTLPGDGNSICCPVLMLAMAFIWRHRSHHYQVKLMEV